MDNPLGETGSDAIETDLIESVPHIKQVSRIKHRILQHYLPVWSRILGSANRRLRYFDCYAGQEQYEFRGHHEDGSPLIAVKTAKRFVTEKPNGLMTVTLIEKDGKQSELLRAHLKPLEPYPPQMDVQIISEDSNTFVQDLLGKTTSSDPSFFMIDPYGHPMSIPLVNQILARQRTETLINVMWYQINRDLANPLVHNQLNKLFGDTSWRDQPFMNESGFRREQGFLSFFRTQLKADYALTFRICFDSEDKMRGRRTKYYLLHASNHPKAILLMKEIMWPLGDEDGTFEFSGVAQGILISKSPKESDLQEILLEKFAGQRIGFDQLRERTCELPFMEKHYRSLLQRLRAEGVIKVTPVTSKKNGLRGADLIEFQEALR